MSGFLWLDVVDESGGSIVDATSSQKGVVQLTGDLAGTAASPKIASLTGTGGVVISTSQLQNTTLANNSATVLRGELLRVVKTVSLIHGATGNFDTTIWLSPARFHVTACYLRFATNVTLGALGAATLSLGTAAGGTQLLGAYAVLGTETTTTAPVGEATSQLGTDLVVGNNFQKTYLSAITTSLRVAVSAGSITAGSVDVELIGYQL
jgi:hypothetical protein